MLTVTEVSSWLAHQYNARMLGKLLPLLPSSGVFEMCSSKITSLLPLVLVNRWGKTLQVQGVVDVTVSVANGAVPKCKPELLSVIKMLKTH